MNYINFNLLYERGFNPVEYCLMVAAHQNAKEDMSDVVASLIGDDARLDELVEQGYLKYIKGTKNQSEIEKIRLDKKGRKLIEDVSAIEVEQEDIIVFDWLEKLYKDRGKEIGNRRKIKSYIAQFRKYSGIDKNNLVLLCKSFCYDEDEQEYSHKLENVFYKPKTHFNIHFDIEESRLYKYYLKHQNMFDKRFEALNNLKEIHE